MILLKFVVVRGHRPKGFTWNYNDKDCESHKAYLKKLQIIIEKFIKEGFNYFISGGAIGADMDFAETIIRLKNKYPFIKLEIAVPCKNQSLLWTSNQKVRYENILMCADKVSLISEKYTSQCMYERNRYLVDSSDLLLAVWNGLESGGTFYTINYAKKKNKRIEFLELYSNRPWN